MKFPRLRNHLLIGVLAGLVLFTTTLAAMDPAQEAAIKRKVERYLTRYFNLAPQESVMVDQVWSVENPPMWGLAVTRVQAGKTTSDVYMLSKDMKQLSLGRVLDFSRDLDAENLAKINLKDTPARGPENAAVTLIEFCDLQCPDCKGMVDNLNAVLPGYEGKVRVLFKNYPLISKHPWSEPAALVARCAYQQNPAAFWNYYDFYYSQQQSITSANLRERSLEVGKQTGLDVDQLTRCFDSKASLPAVQSDVFEALKLGVKGTPTLLINGRFVFNEDMTQKDYRKLIDEALASSKQ
ncbi:MAG: DsbA family protein [Acidobacteriia bacterium]|nr:DsbA family protein [Terriglobia bacterium]